MIDIGVTKLAIIGGIALVVIGPEKLPGLAKTIGTLLGRARRYVADVKAEVNRSMELDELKKMKDTVENAARDLMHFNSRWQPLRTASPRAGPRTCSPQRMRKEGVCVLGGV